MFDQTREQVTGHDMAMGSECTGAWRMWLLAEETRRYPLSLMVGVLFGLAFPTPGIAGLAWLVPGLLWVSCGGLSLGSAFRVGWVAGCVGFLISLRWLLNIPFASGAVAAWLSLSLYCGLSLGLWTLGLAWAWNRFADSIPGHEQQPPELDSTKPRRIPDPIPSDILHELDADRPRDVASVWRRWGATYVGQAWTRRLLWGWFAAAGWVALEMVRARFLTGFPWNFLGVSQWRQVPLIQIASITGVYGLSFLITWASMGLWGAGLHFALSQGKRTRWLTDLRLPVFAVCLVLGWGMYRVLDHRNMERAQDGESIRLALIQPAIPQTLMWDADASDDSFEVAARLTEQALALQPDVLVWPEGSFGLSQENFDRIRYQTVEAEVAWIFGGDGRAVTADGQVDVFNSAYLIGATGGMEARYDKCRLVIFGEFIPFENWLPFMRWLTPIGSSFSKGQGAVPFPLLNGTWEASPVICFEDIFAHSTRRHVLDQTDFFLELTNDGWFGESSAQWQHAANVALRSVENGTPLVRCTNNGITGWFDGCGVLRQILGGGGSEVYKEGLLLANIPRRPMSMSQTIYRRWGDAFGWSCFIGVTMWFAWQGVRRWAGQGGR